MGRFQWFMQAASHHSTMWIGARYGDKFPMHFVCGYPRSGTTWFSELLADYLNLPRPRHYMLPLAFASVVHTHVPSRHKLGDCFYVVRDGRDAIISLYFKLIKTLKEDPAFVYRSQYMELFKNDLDDVSHNLPVFIKKQLERNKGHWGRHVSGWLEKSKRPGSKINVIRYEDLLKDTIKFFSEVLLAKYGSVDTDIVEYVVERHHFANQKKRPSDQHRTFLRKGIAGDWRNWFTPECAAVFNNYAGPALISAGYERDQSWISMENNQ